MKNAASTHKKPVESVSIGSTIQNYLSKNYLVPLFLACVVVLSVVTFSQPPAIRGDGNEYLHMLQSFADHGSPELTTQDINEVNVLRLYDSLDMNSVPYSGYYNATSGNYYSYHFWLYSLLALPQKVFLKIFGQDELRAFQATNLILLLAALAATLFKSGFDNQRKLIFGALIVLSPAVWYLSWPSPEVFSFSFVVISIAFASRERYILAVLLAGLAATQNPPILILMLFFCGLSLLKIWRTKNYVELFALGACALPAFTPNLFYFVNFGTPNLIYKVGAASLSAISFQKILSFVFDLNIGLLPYLPLVMLLFAYLFFRKRDLKAYLLVLVMAAMLLLATTTENWNSDSVGLMRYAVWFLPLIFWEIADGYDGSRRDKILLISALVPQYFIATIFPSYAPSYLENNGLANYVLGNFPAAYSPEPEIFAERLMGKEIAYKDRLPIIYRRKDGAVTKILTDNQALKRLQDFVDVDTDFLAAQTERHKGEKGLFYINAPGGEMRVEAQDSVLANCKDQITLSQDIAIRKTSTYYRVPLTVTNRGKEPWFAEGDFPISIACHVFDKNNRLLSSDFIKLLHLIKPGKSDSIPMVFQTPSVPGAYYVQFDLVQENLGWFKDHGNKALEIQMDIK